MLAVLDRQTLILNKGYYPINAKPVHEVMGDIFEEKVSFIEPVTYERHNLNSWIDRSSREDPMDCVQLVRDRQIWVPLKGHVAILSEFDKVPKQKVKFNRYNLWKRDNYTCQYCGKKPRHDELSVDHVIPKSHGSHACFENCVLACVKCNKRKNNRTPEQAGMRLRRAKIRNGVVTYHYYDRPTRPHWNPIYAFTKREIPSDWSVWLKNLVDELYWNIELEE